MSCDQQVLFIHTTPEAQCIQHKMCTQQKRLNYRVLNGESDRGSLPEDQTNQSSESRETPSNLTRTLPSCLFDTVILANIPDCQHPTSESVVAGASIPREPNRCRYFDHKPSILSMVQIASTGHRVDLGIFRDYCRGLFMGYQADQQEAANQPRDFCLHVDEKMRTRCDWHTSNSQR